MHGKTIDLGRNCTGSVSVDADNNLYATSKEFTLSVSKGDITASATTYRLQGTGGLINLDGYMKINSIKCCGIKKIIRIIYLHMI